MPIYCYSCKDCNYEFEIKHSMSFEGQNCPKCESLNVFKLPSLSVLKRPQDISKSRPGKLVDEYIKETRLSVKKEKQNLKSEVL